MRMLALALVLALGCGKKSSTPQGTGSAGSATAAAKKRTGSAEPIPLAVHHVTLLQPEDVINTRIIDQKSFAATIKHAMNAVLAYDAAHPGVLPPDFDLFVATRPFGTRAWLVGPDGDIPMKEIEDNIAKAPNAVKDGTVAAAATITRAGSEAKPRELYLPLAWKSAPGSNVSMDEAIDRAWPR